MGFQSLHHPSSSRSQPSGNESHHVVFLHVSGPFPTIPTMSKQILHKWSFLKLKSIFIDRNPAGNVSQEIQLTQDLIELFVRYQAQGQAFLEV